jgi:hypothetical protein
MFARLARLAGDRCRHGAPVTPAHSNNNRPDRRFTSAPQRARRQVLVCRWRPGATTGRLECRWQIEPVDETSAEEPGPMLGKGDVYWLLGVGLLGKRSRPTARVMTWKENERRT